MPAVIPRGRWSEDMAREHDEKIRGSDLFWRIIGIFAAAFVIGGGLFLVGDRSGQPRADHPPPAAKPAKRRRPVDESGFALAYRGAVRTPHDPTSLPSLRAAFHDLGYRGVRDARIRPARSPEQQINKLLDVALLNGYEGEFAKAAESLRAARALLEERPSLFDDRLATVIFLQGVMALRRGEVENCVSCCCQCSCIFPLQPQAFHLRRDGSNEAVKYFTEYLQDCPEDVGVRWLLNLTYMTLGDFPSGVPEQYRLPLDASHSEFDIGRFVDVASPLGLDRLHRSGGACERHISC